MDDGTEWEAGEGEPAESLLVGELETLRVVSDALRARILDHLRQAPLTAKELAARVELAPKQLYYHLGLMERHGLIRVVRTRVVSGIIEKQYRATAHLFLFDKSVFASADARGALPPGLAMLFDTTRNQLAQSFEAGLVDDGDGPQHERLLHAWSVAHLAPERAAAFYAALAALLDEFGAVECGEAEQSYRLFVTLFPVRRGRSPEEQ